jgi:hypothetical protein
MPLTSVSFRCFILLAQGKSKKDAMMKRLEKQPFSPVAHDTLRAVKARAQVLGRYAGR